MPDEEHEGDMPPPADGWPARARQWRRVALALAALFGTLPVASKLLLGSWGFDGAVELACLCLAAAAYFHLAARERWSPLPDSAAMLDRAIRLAAAGETARGIAVLDEALRLSPRLWQAREYRGQIRLGELDAAARALEDFTEAIRLAPGEPHLSLLRSHVFTLLGQESQARADLETAARLGGDAGAPFQPEELPGA
jgi:tetratricopeptide (TPR) repeat protein